MSKIIKSGSLDLDTIEEFKKIYTNLQLSKIVPFLQKLNTKQKKQLVPLIKEYSEGMWKEGSKASPIPKFILIATAIVCCTSSQFKRCIPIYWDSEYFSYSLISEVLEWYCPEWFSDFFNAAMEKGNRYLSYSTLLQWREKGYIVPNSLLIARTLVQVVYTYNSENSVHTPEILEQNPVSLEKDIWTLFEHETGIHYRDQANVRWKKGEEGVWSAIFRKYTRENRIDRFRVLQGCLQTVKFDIQKESGGWFADLLGKLEPIQEELLALQEDLFIALSSPHTKMVNRALTEIKKIVALPEFKTEEFISHLPVLWSFTTKNILHAVLSVVEIVLKHNKEKTDHILSETLPVFLNKDKTIQDKAVKLITKYGDIHSSQLKENLNIYTSGLLSSSREILKNYLETSPVLENLSAFPEESGNINPIDKANRIPEIKTWDDWVFFLSRLFVNQEPHDIDIFLSYLPKMAPQVTNENINQLESLFIRAYEVLLSYQPVRNFDYHTKEYLKTYFWGAGLYNRLLANLLMDYGQFLCCKFPEGTTFITQLHEEAIETARQKTKKDYWKTDFTLRSLQDWNPEYKLVNPYKSLMLYVFNQIEKEESNLPLLSTPTHLPMWIETETLIQRLEEYEKVGKEPDSFDFQIALSRCIPQEIEKLQKKSEVRLSKKYYQSIVSFYEGSFTIIKEYNHNLFWKISQEKQVHYSGDKFYSLEMSLPVSPRKKEPCIFSDIGENLEYNYIGPQDIENYLLVYPAFASLLYSQLLQDRFVFANISSAKNRDMLIDGITVLHSLKTEVKDSNLLYLACCMLCSNKVLQDIAKELWLERTRFQLLNNYELGVILGKLIGKEWATAKRLTTIIENSCININSQINKELETLFIGILLQIPDKPVSYLKKILEIYNELQVINQSGVDEKLVKKIQVWEQVNNLKKICKQILK